MNMPFTNLNYTKNKYKSSLNISSTMKMNLLNGMMLVINEGVTKNTDPSKTAPQRLHKI